MTAAYLVSSFLGALAVTFGFALEQGAAGALKNLPLRLAVSIFNCLPLFMRGRWFLLEMNETRRFTAYRQRQLEGMMRFEDCKTPVSARPRFAGTRGLSVEL